MLFTVCPLELLEIEDLLLVSEDFQLDSEQLLLQGLEYGLHLHEVLREPVADNPNDKQMIL